MVDAVYQDVRHAVRTFGRSPVFTATSILSLTVGIAATTAIITIADTLLLRPPPGIDEPDRVVMIGRTQDGQGFDNFSYPNFVDYRDGVETLSGMAAVQVDPRPVSLAGPDGGEAVASSVVSGTFFDVLQARPALGRFFLPDEDIVPRARPVVVLSHRLWRHRFAADSGIIGRSITLNKSSFTVVGVAEERFQGPFVLAPDLWVPLMAAPLVGRPEELLTSRRAVWLLAIGRLAPDVPLGAAQGELSGIARRLEDAYPEINRARGLRIVPTSLLPWDMRRLVAGFMAMLLAVAALVLMIASTNVAGVLLARASARRREIAVRLALGATRGRLLQLLVTESLLLFIAAGIAGVFLTKVLVNGMLALLPNVPVQLIFEPSVDWRVLLIATGITVTCGLLAGLAPAVPSSRPALVPALKSEGAAGHHRLRLRGGLLIAQIALSMLLLVGAGLFARALATARAIDPGFDPRGVYVASLDLDLAQYDRDAGTALGVRLLERASRLPGAQAVALSAMLPLDGGGLGLGGIEVPGRQPPDRERGWDADWNVVSPGYFDVMRTPIVRGRAFTEADRRGAAEVAIINETLAERLFPGEEAVGQTFRNEGRTITIVGIAGDAKYRTLGEAPRAFICVPFAQRYFARVSVLVRTTSMATAAPAVRRLIGELDPSLPIIDQRRLEEQLAFSLFPQRIALWVAGSLGVVALFLAVLGIYGVTAYGVAQRTREIGIRVALGAQRANVLGLVVRQGFILAAAGVGIGLLVAFAVTRLMSNLLYGVPPTDVTVFVGAAALLVGAALAASWIPARRAAALDPMVALRDD